MINGLEGIPGSGKSYEAVVYHVLEALKRGRKVITNLPLRIEQWAALDPRYLELIEIRTRNKPVRGTWDVNRVDDHGNGSAFELWPDGRVEPAPDGCSVFGHVWDYYEEWKHPQTGQGPLYVIDECHVGLPKLGTPKQVIEWFKLHRHFNADVLLMTQSFRDMCQEIARLMAMLVRCRKADILGRKDHYIRKVFSGHRGAEISREERKYLPQYFVLYRSHTQGNSVAEAGPSDVAPFIVKWKRFTWAWWAFAVVFAAWAFWPSKGQPLVPVKRSAVASASPVAASVVVGAPVAAASAPTRAASSADSQAGSDDVEPCGGKDLHISGRLRMGSRELFVFTVSDKGRRIFEVTSVDLKEAGYSFQALGECAGMLRRAGKSRAVTCDAPVISAGGADRPIVFGMPVAVSDKRGLSGGVPSVSSCGPDCYVAPNSSGTTVQGYDPDRVSSPARSVFERKS